MHAIGMGFFFVKIDEKLRGLQPKLCQKMLQLGKIDRFQVINFAKLEHFSTVIRL